jgi:hypothetical protein
VVTAVGVALASSRFAGTKVGVAVAEDVGVSAAW